MTAKKKKEEVGEKEEVKPMNVDECICAVMGELVKVGISKENTNKQQGYKFRGIDDVYNILAKFLHKHKLTITPKTLSRERIECQSKSGGVVFHAFVMVEYTLTSAWDGSSKTAVLPGEAMDSGDKSTNKAMSAAYKYLCLQEFCIPTEGDNDADFESHEIVSQAPTEEQKKRADEMFRRIDGAKDGDALMNAWAEVNNEFKGTTFYGEMAEKKDAKKKEMGIG